MNNDEYQQLQHSAQAVSEVKNSLKIQINNYEVLHLKLLDFVKIV